jgi:hypothetical protein
LTRLALTSAPNLQTTGGAQLRQPPVGDYSC